MTSPENPDPKRNFESQRYPATKDIIVKGFLKIVNLTEKVKPFFRLIINQLRA